MSKPIEVILTCEKCGKKEIIELKPAEEVRISFFLTPHPPHHSIRETPAGDPVLLCPDCYTAVDEFMFALEQNNGEKIINFIRGVK